MMTETKQLTPEDIEEPQDATGPPNSDYDGSFDLKFLDHIFDAVKLMITVFVRLVAVYVTILAVFSAAYVSDFLSVDLINAFRWGCFIATGAVTIFMVLFHHYVQRAIVGYCDIATEIPFNRRKEKIAKYRRKVAHFGSAMFAVGLFALALSAIALWYLPIVQG